MKLLAMTFAKLSEEQFPSTVTVEMGVREAALIAKLFGRMRHAESQGATAYECLVGDVFDRYWDDGVDEAMRALGLSAPPEFKRGEEKE